VPPDVPPARPAGHPGDPGPADWSLGRLLSTAARMVEHDWNAWLAERGVTHAGLLALDALDQGPLTQRQLAAASRVEEQTMSRVLGRLERTGHVERRRDTVDRRRLVVSLTASGRDVLGQIRAADVADALVADRLSDPTSFRAELVRLVAWTSGGGKEGEESAPSLPPPEVREAGTGGRRPRPARRSARPARG
jgi:MarR family transcriptional regulator, organic hydroperoxide resistance regulator